MFNKSKFATFVVMAMVTLFYVGATPSYAQDSSMIVVVDIQQLETMSVAGKALRKKIDAKRQSLLAEVKKEESSLKAKQQEIAKARSSLSAEEFKAKAQAFEAKFRDAQAKITKKRQSFEKSAVEAHGKLRKEVVSVVGDISTEKKYKLVVSRQSVVIVEKSIDITAQAMDKLNAKVKSIPFK